ncbi:MAG: epoxide hydrolase family protein [Parvibaculales bacterium]
MTPFDITVSDTGIQNILDKVAAYDWSTMQDFAQPDAPWAGGGNQAYLREFCSYWLTDYKWDDTVAELSAFPHYRDCIDGLDIHYLMEPGSGTNPPALIMTHGWPGSVYEFMNVIPRLAHPERFGGDAEDGMTVICPSLPGYGWSGKPDTPIGPKQTAALYDKLMTKVLGHDSYIAQGGDWGSLVTGFLGLNHCVAKGGGCRAIHLNMYGLAVADEPSSAEELKWLETFKAVMAAETGYLHVQSTRPLSLAYAMMDSPVGVAAWLLDKFVSWSDLRPRADKSAHPGLHLEHVYTKHQLLSNIMIYLTTKSFNSASWYYLAYFSGPTGMAPGERVSVPAGVANYAHELITFPPRSLVDRGYHVTQWTDHDRGGHFAAFEVPETFAADVQRFVTSL